jgi:hypothetical protein
MGFDIVHELLYCARGIPENDGIMMRYSAKGDLLLLERLYEHGAL